MTNRKGLRANRDRDRLPKRGLYFLVKFVESLDFAEQFRAGRLYMKPLQDFVELEEKTDGRGDRYDSLSQWHQPKDISVFELGGRRFDLADFAGPLIFQEFAPVNVLCLYAGSTTAFKPASQEPAKVRDELRQYMRIPVECLRLGPIAVLVHKFKMFNERFDRAVLREKYNCVRGPVKYFDPETYSGTLDPPGFWKRDSFSWQREYRYSVETGRVNTDPLVLDVGDLSDICVTCRSEDLVQHLMVHFAARTRP